MADIDVGVPPGALVLLLSFLLLIGLFWQLYYVFTKPRSKSLPPEALSFPDFVHHMRKGDAAYWLSDCFRQQADSSGAMEIKSDPVTRMLSGGRFFVVSEDRTARRVMEEPSTIKWRISLKFFTDTSNGENLISECVNGQRWKHVRKATATAFSPPNIRLVVEHIDQILNRWVCNKLKPLAVDDKPLDVLDEMKFVTAQVIMKAGFDYMLGEKECRALLKSLDTCFYEFGTACIGEPLRQFEMTRWMYDGIRKGRVAAARLHEFCTKVLMSYRLQKEKKSHLIIDMIENDEEYANDHERVCDMCAYIVAGFDTTANTLSFALLELAKNQQEQNKLRQSLKSCETKEDGRYCPALKNVVKEVMRLHPVAANGTVRYTGKDIPVEGSPYVIPSGSVVMMPFYAIQRNPSLYEEPDTFKPDRWDNASERMMQCYMPFSAGRRSCQGQALANAEMFTILSSVVADFEFGIAEEGTSDCFLLHEPVGLKLSVRRVEPEKPAKTDKNQHVGLGVLGSVLGSFLCLEEKE